MTKITHDDFRRAVDYLAADQATAPEDETNADFYERHGLDTEAVRKALEAVGVVTILTAIEQGDKYGEALLPELVQGGFELGFVLGRQTAGAQPFVEDGAAA